MFNILYICNFTFIAGCLKFDFPKHGQMHAVYRLELHLPLEQSVYFHGNADDQALKQAMNRDSKLTGCFKLNIADPSARHLLYDQILYEFVWRDRSWHRRERQYVISRFHTTNPRDRKLLSLRLLLLHVPGATSFEYLRTVNEVLHPSFSTAEKGLQLLEDYRECDDCLAIVVSYQMPRQMRQLFAFICISTDVKVDLNQLWIKYKHSLYEDYLKRKLPVLPVDAD